MLNDDKTIDVIESDYAKALPAVMKKEGKEANVATTMSSIAKEAQGKLNMDDPSRVPPEDVT